MSRNKAFFITLAAFLYVLAIALAFLYYAVWQHWLAYATGSYNIPGVAHNYNFFSGAGSDLSEVTIVTGIALMVYHAYRKGNCHTHGCWRVGSLPVGDYRVCKRCHRKATGARVDLEHLKVHFHLHQRKRLLDAGYKPKEQQS